MLARPPCQNGGVELLPRHQLARLLPARRLWRYIVIDENVVAEKDRFYSRLSMIPGVRPMHSIGDWILVQCEKPQDLARRVARRLDPTLVSVPRHIEGVVRVIVSDPKTNERLLRTIREAVA